MRHTSLKPALMSATIALAALVAAGPAAAQMPGATPTAGALTPAVLQAHQADLEAMISDLSRVTSASAAKEYEGYLGNQLPKYVQNHKTLHHGAMPGFHKMKGGLMGPHKANQEAIANATDKLSETHFPRLAAEMDRVEKLNPSLKKHFDVLRNLD